SGIGHALATLLDKNGYQVFGISYPAFSEDSNIVHYEGDIRDEKRINEVVGEIYKKAGQIDILVNNAGMGISGSIEGTKLDAAKMMFDINFMGTFIVTKAVLPYMRERKSGKIVNLSSVASEFSIPFQAFYSSSKAAIKTFTEALNNEVSPYGIRACAILPGDIKSNFTKNRVKNIKEDAVYLNRVKKSVNLMEKDEQNGMTVEYASKVIFKVLKKKKMPIQKIIGKKYKVFVFVKRFIGSKTINKLVGKIYGFKKD
ncbi:MAG: SDR family NAD(P)-dependent oxidoreductase, partial [Acholeplasma sp.]|nr:SDR family NAD(P)-dependent oxidoreductase [Acholeplasma sp.]